MHTMLHNNNKAFGDIPEHTNKRKGITMALTACYSIVQNMLTTLTLKHSTLFDVAWFQRTTSKFNVM